MLTVSLGKNILGRLSKVNVSGRYSHSLERERGCKRLRPGTRGNKKIQEALRKITSLLSSFCVTASGQPEQPVTAEGQTQ